MDSRTLAAVLRAIAAGKVTRKAAARRLGGISERQVNRLMKAHGVARPRGAAAAARSHARFQSEVRRLIRAKQANHVVAGSQGIEEAAAKAGCSVRTMYRWVSALRKSSDFEQKRVKKKKNDRKTSRNRRK